MIATIISRETKMETVRSSRIGNRVLGALLGIALVMPSASALAQQALFRPRATELVLAQPPLPSSAAYSLQLVLDDNVQEGSFGVSGGLGAQQFMWFNRFTIAGGAPTRLEQVWVLFPGSANVSVGSAVQIVVYADTDADPSNGAQLLSSFDTTIQFADDTTFSIYDLPTPLNFNGATDVLVGVIPRFINSGVTPPTSPAAVDTSTSAGRSWIAVWNGDPPATPTLPPDVLITRIDDLQPGGGNWMIRAFGTTLPTPAIPATDPWALTLLAAVMALAAMKAMRRG